MRANTQNYTLADLPSFAPRFNFSAGSAWIDAMELAFEARPARFRSIEELRSTLLRLSRGAVFRVSNGGYGTATARADTSSGSEMERARWLFGANVSFARQTAGAGWTYQVTLRLNPMRLLSHHAHNIPRNGQLTSVDYLVPNPHAKLRVPQATLDGNDNYLLDTGSAYAAQQLNWQEFLENYVRLVTEIVEQSLLEAQVMLPETEDIWGGWTLRKLESVWEFQNSRAIETARKVANFARSSCRSGHEKWHAQGLSVSAPLHNNIDLVAYAKSINRFRIEVRHVKAIRRTYGARATTSELPNDNIGCLPRFVSFLHERAAERANSFFQQYQESLEPSSVTDVALLGRAINKVVDACRGKDRERRIIIAALLTEGRVAEASNANLRPHCERLVRSGVLVRLRTRSRERKRTYNLAAEYRAISQRL